MTIDCIALLLKYCFFYCFLLYQFNNYKIFVDSRKDLRMVSNELNANKFVLKLTKTTKINEGNAVFSYQFMPQNNY